MEEEIQKKQKRKKLIKKIIKIILFLIILSSIITGIILYRENRNVQNFFDENIFKKTIQENSLEYIETTSDSNTHICAFENYIGVLRNNTLTGYNSHAKPEFTVNLTITSPLFISKGKYLAVAEKSGNKLYLIADQNIVWQADVEGKIEKVTVNKNGYVAVAVTQTSYKTVVITYNLSGKEICKTYLSRTYAVDIEISDDNKNLAIAETNLSGIQIKTEIRIIALDKVEQDAEHAVIYKKEVGLDSIITSIHYDAQNNLICMLDDKIIKIENGEQKEIINYNEKALFAEIDLEDYIVEITEEANEETQIKVKVTNTTNLKNREYIINSIPKEVKTKGKTIAINAGSEAYFITATGFLKQKYEAKQEIKEIVLNENIAAIIYKNKIEILKF